MARSGEAATMEVPAETISDNDPVSPRFQAGLLGRTGGLSQ